MIKILITGSNGIIGTQVLLQALEAYPTAAITIINRSKGDFEHARITSIECDLITIDEKAASDIMEQIKPDLFFHLAWDTNHKDYLTTPDNVKWEKVSILLIDSFYKCGGQRFVGIGSSIEYDWNFPSPFKESTSPLEGNKWLYGKSKLNVYRYLESLSDKSFLWCRVFFVFGPGQGDSRLIPLIINSALNGGSPLKINTELKRDYISTFEIAKQIIMMQGSPYSGAVNICSGRATKLGDIVSCISKQISREVLLSEEKYADNFDFGTLGGSIDVIKKYNENYSYSQKQFEDDIKNTITHFLEKKSIDKSI